MLHYQTRPLSDRSWLRPNGRRTTSQFTTAWGTTLDELEREIVVLGGKQVVIEVDVREQDLRIDGRLRATAKAETPAVVVAFESKHGPLVYRCDRFVRPPRRAWHTDGMESWQHNVRAIAMTLEALRAVDRYGVSSSGEQYRGYKALPVGSNGASHMTQDEALILLREMGGNYSPGASMAEVAKMARVITHPDANEGDRRGWDRVEVAIEVLTRAGVLTPT